jgi:hypothetical protein
MYSSTINRLNIVAYGAQLCKRNVNDRQRPGDNMTAPCFLRRGSKATVVLRRHAIERSAVAVAGIKQTTSYLGKHHFSVLAWRLQAAAALLNRSLT